MDFPTIAKAYAVAVVEKRQPAGRLHIAACARYLKMLDLAAKPKNEFYFSPPHVIDYCAFAEKLQHPEEGNWRFTQDDAAIILEPWQIWQESAIHGFRWHGTNERVVSRAYSEVPRKHAKALALDTPIPTPAGWTTMGEINVGDVVYSADGKEAVVQAVSEVFVDHDCYEVEFANGEKIVADAGHKWLTTAKVNKPGSDRKTFSRYRNPRLNLRKIDGREYYYASLYGRSKCVGPASIGGDRAREIFEALSVDDLVKFPMGDTTITRVRTTAEIAETLTYGVRDNFNHTVAMPMPIQGKDISLPVDPYLLGAWLGDGMSSGFNLSCGREDVDHMEEMVRRAGFMPERRKDSGKNFVIRVRNFGDGKTATPALRSIGLLLNKHIPQQYLRASVEQRIGLLRGLMDTDGTADKTGRQLSFCNIKKALVDGFCELLSSLGVKFTVRRCVSKISGRAVKNDHYKVDFCVSHEQFLPFTLPRKVARVKARATRSRTNSIVAVKRVTSVPVKCISVDHPSHLFLAGRTMLPTHNSELMGIAALYDLCCNGQEGPQVVIGASTVEQANRVFTPVSRMAGKEPELIVKHQLTITSKEIRSAVNNGELFKLSSQGERQDGLNPSLAIMEEMHAQPESVYRVVNSARGARPNSLMRIITTAGYHASGVGYSLRKEAEMILTGAQEDYSFFALVCTIDPEDYIDPETKEQNITKLLTDQALMMKANPMWGVSIDPRKIMQQASEAMRSPDKRGEFLRTRYNLWNNAGATLVDPIKWQACRDKNISLSRFFGRKCWIGVDLASESDMCAIGLVFDIDGGDIAVFARYFLPRFSPTLSDPDMFATMLSWEKDGHLIVTEGGMADYDRIEDELDTMCEVFDVQAMAFDPYQSNNIMYRLWQKNLPVGKYPNNAMTMTMPTDNLISRVSAGKLKHDGHPILEWNASNVCGEKRGNGSIMPRKDTPNSPRKIDGFVAITFANGVKMNPAMFKPEATEEMTTSAYAKRGIIGFEGNANGN